MVSAFPPCMQGTPSGRDGCEINSTFLLLPYRPCSAEESCPGISHAGGQRTELARQPSPPGAGGGEAEQEGAGMGGCMSESSQKGLAQL